jgi:hypothetical protein
LRLKLRDALRADTLAPGEITFGHLHAVVPAPPEHRLGLLRDAVDQQLSAGQLAEHVKLACERPHGGTLWLHREHDCEGLSGRVHDLGEPAFGSARSCFTARVVGPYRELLPAAAVRSME